MYKFFVTGGFGYIGLSFADRALSQGYRVHLFDNLCYEQDYLYWVDKLNKYGPLFSFSLGDTRNSDYLKSEIKKMDPSHIMHWGDLSSVYACNHNPSYTISVCSHATKKLVDLAVEMDKYFFYNSSSSVYGAQNISRLDSELSELPPASDLYCKYKIEAESYIKLKKLETPSARLIVFRPATVFGVAPRFRIELLPNHFFYMGYESKTIKVADENSYRSSIDVSDLVDAYFHVIKKEENDELIYNVGNQNMTKLEYALAVQRHVKCEIVSIPNFGDLRNLQIDSTKFQREFSYSPKKSLDESFDDIKKYFDVNLSKIKRDCFAGLLNMPLNKWHEIN
jgi:nucleoside-diphosphate-sugar epimerase